MPDKFATAQSAHLDPPLVSVIMSCYNSERYLQQTLKSVLSQSYTRWELVAVDDGSSDNTLAMLKQASEADARVKVIRRLVRGGRPAITKNTGLQAATGEFIAFLDHDDLYLPNRLAAMVPSLAAHPECVAAFHDLEYVDAAGTVTGRYLNTFLDDAKAYLQKQENTDYVCSEDFYKFQVLRYAALHTITCLIARNRIPADTLRFNEQFVVCEDTDLWIRLGQHGRMLYSPEVWSQYRLHETNITRNLPKVQSDIVRLIELNVNRMEAALDDVQMAQLKSRLANAYSDLGWAWRCQGEHKSARAAYRNALRLKPELRTLRDWIKAGLHVRHSPNSIA